MAIAEQDTLFPLPDAAPIEMATWDERLDLFTRMAKAKDGLVPQSAVADILDVSKVRVSQLMAANRLEKIVYFGQNYVSGRSLRDYMAEEKMATGRGMKKMGRWKAIVVGMKVGLAVGKSCGD